MQKQFSLLVCLAVVIASCHGFAVAGKFDWQSFKHLARNVAVKSYNTVKDEVKSWRPWSEWTECTRKCGRGVHSRIRYCETGRHGSPPYSKYGCYGPAIESKVCTGTFCSNNNNH
ncbi:hypothetical protein EB796_025247 [Bugula neritina]|uniref:Uncharacterized protein n=1 Tax=Bugula neritina TaxID=10212 RepID=A0A7J7ISS4_BUGNE|nr:hypothetical protein EB796_025247 [Bugula neritina]